MFRPQTAVANPGLTDLAQASVEAHVAVDHQAFPSNSSDAGRWSGRMRRVLERSAPGDIIVADNAAEPLSEAAVANAKILFICWACRGFCTNATARAPMISATAARAGTGPANAWQLPAQLVSGWLPRVRYLGVGSEAGRDR